MVNLSLLDILQNKTDILNCLEPEVCAKECMKFRVDLGYEFVWLFVMGFIFSECSGFIYRIKIENKKVQNGLVTGFKLAGFMLNLAGFIWFLVVLG